MNQDGSVEITTAESSSTNHDVGPTANRWRYPRGDRFAGLLKNVGSGWPAAGETNVWSRYRPLVAALAGHPTQAHGLDADADGDEDVAYGDGLAVQALWRGTPVGRAGWTGADVRAPGPSSGWNGAATTVDAIRRVPIEGITQCQGDPSPSSETRELVLAATPVVVASATGGRGRAVLVVPERVPGECDVMLHLHGFNIGWRRPAAVDRAPRDVRLDRIEAQLATFQTTAAMLSVLPQGTTHSRFGLPGADDYLDEVLGVAAMASVFGSRPTVRRLVVSAHSGGGLPALDLVSPPRPAAVPSRLFGVMLFEAIPRPAIAGGNVRLLDDVEKDYILAALELNGGNQTRTAEQLGIGSATMYRKLKSYGVSGGHLAVDRRSPARR